MRIWIRIAIGLAIVMLVVAGSVAKLRMNSMADRIYGDTTISGVRVGGLTKAAASERLTAWQKERLNGSVTMRVSERAFALTRAQLGLSVDFDKSLDDAYNLGRSSGYFRNAWELLTNTTRGRSFQAVQKIDSARLSHQLRRLAGRVDVPHKDAKLAVIGEAFSPVPEKAGRKLDIERAQAQLLTAILANQNDVSLPVVVDKPSVTRADVTGVDTLLARFTTRFNTGKRDRSHNLELAARAISGTVIAPGGVFSYNDSVGPRLEGRGFREAIVFVKGKQEPGLGGGICQVSSTLYNAVLLAGLDIVERHHHSRTVAYVPAARDATVAWGSRDFRFRNTNTFPIGVIASHSGSHLTISIYGSARDMKQVKLIAQNLAHQSPSSEQITDPAMAAGSKKVIDKGSDGITAVLYREMVGPDGQTVRERISKDRYPPQNRIVAVGKAPQGKTAEKPSPTINAEREIRVL